MRKVNLLYLASLVVAVIGLLAVPSAGRAAYGDYSSTVGTGGLNQPAKIAASVSGDVYVTDAGNKLVKRYSAAGTYDSGFSLSVSGTPVGIATNGTNIFVGDDTNDCVWIYDMSGSLADLSGTGSTHKLGSGSTALKMPNTVTVAPSGHIFVVDGDSDKVYIFNASGSLNSSFGVSNSTVSSGTTINVYYPCGLTMADSSSAAGSTTQYFYLGDQGNFRVQRLYYVYDDATKAITTAPTYAQTIGSKGDAFGQFLRVSDVAWDPYYSRLAVVDSLQMVAQLFTSAGATMSQAFNYSGGAVEGNLNIPTGGVFSQGKFYVANNQGDSIVLYAAATGTAPAPLTVDPATDITPSVTPASINYSVDDTDSSTVTMNFFYEKVGTSTRVPISLNNQVTLVGGTYSGSFSWNWAVDPGPSVGSYKVVAVAIDDTANVTEQYSAGSLLVVTPYDGCTNYTNAHFALYGAASSDYDGDTLSNCDEINGTSNSAYGNAATNMALLDTDGDGLDDGVECGTKNLDTNLLLVMTGAFTISTNPTAADTDGGGASDAVEIVKGTNQNSAGDDLVLASSPQELVLSHFCDGINNQHATLAFRNLGTTDMVFDLVYYNKNGGINTTAPAVAYLSPNETIHFEPFVKHGVNEGSIELRATSVDVSGDVIRFRHNYLDPTSFDCGDSTKFIKPSEGATFMMTDTWSDSDAMNRRFQDYIYVKNYEDASANITIDFRQNSDGASSAHLFTLAAHEVVEVKPRDYVPGTWVGGAIEISSDTPVTGYHYRERFNATDINAYDVGTFFDFVTTTALESYSPVWSDSTLDSRRFIGYAYVYNPNDVAIDATLTFWDNNGVLEGTQTYTGATAIQPHMKAVFRPTSLLPAPAAPGGTFKIVTTGGEHIGGIFIQRYRLGDMSYMDWSYYMPTAPLAAAADVQYINHYRDNPQVLPAADTDRFIAFNYIYNPDPVNPMNVALDFYDASGAYMKTSNFTINPLNKKTVQPYRQEGGATDGSFTITSTLPFFGYSMGQYFSATDLSSMDYGFKKFNNK